MKTEPTETAVEPTVEIPAKDMAQAVEILTRLDVVIERGIEAASAQIIARYPQIHRVGDPLTHRKTVVSFIEGRMARGVRSEVAKALESLVGEIRGD